MEKKEIKEKLLQKVFEDALMSKENKYYFQSYEDNLIYKKNNKYSLWYSDVIDELSNGSGKELQSKFRAIYSSAALCVNSFSFFKRSECINIPFVNGLLLNGGLKFESKLSTGISSAKANLDVEINSKNDVVFIESKFLEYYNKSTKLNISQKYSSYSNVKQLIDKYKNIKDKCSMDCIKQLICHFTAINHALENGEFHDKNVYLCFLYWSSGMFSEQESDLLDLLESFKENLDNKPTNPNNIKFIYSTYNELYEIWGQSKDAELKSHSQILKDKYIISI